MAVKAVALASNGLCEHFGEVRSLSRAIAAPLTDADATIQPMPDASPAKWHLAHTTWFFETFVLRDSASYQPFDERFAYLFNSYYEGEGERHARDRRGMLSRPGLDEVLAYRDHIDQALVDLLPELGEDPLQLVELGLNHEQQHQELMLMDMLATFHQNPLRPAVWQTDEPGQLGSIAPLGWTEAPGGIVEIGQSSAGFAFDCEGPRHSVLLRPYALADRLVTNSEWLSFIEDHGYDRPELWLADGWAWVRDQQIRAPLYWEREAQGWSRFGLDGSRPLNPAEPVCHISHYEADAFARWYGARLPTEAEWEAAAAGSDPNAGNQLDQAGPVRPVNGTALFGGVWQWTMSAFLPHPGFIPAEGTVGEYNGKFMSGQIVLKGASCATPRGHSRSSYRNFFYPHQRWQYAGLRLARDL
jgi:ergothioneine biosynthesis protein EgtB